MRDGFTELLRIGHVLEDTSPTRQRRGIKPPAASVFDADTKWLHNGILYIKTFDHRLQTTAMLMRNHSQGITIQPL